MSLEKFWEEYAIGDRMVTGGRTIVDADVRLFNGATDASHPAHVDVEYAARHPFGRVTVPGSLIIGVVDGLVVKYLVPQEKKVVHYGYDRIRFVKPVFFGDTVHVGATVMEKRARSDGMGLIVFNYEVKKQDGTTVAILADLQLVETGGSGSPPAGGA